MCLPSTRPRSARSMLKMATVHMAWDASSSMASRIHLLPLHSLKPQAPRQWRISLFQILTLHSNPRISWIWPQKVLNLSIRAAKTYLNLSKSKINLPKISIINQKRCKLLLSLFRRERLTQKSWSTASMWAFRSNKRSSPCIKKGLKRKLASRLRLRAPDAAPQNFSIWISIKISNRD